MFFTRVSYNVRYSTGFTKEWFVVAIYLSDLDMTGHINALISQPWWGWHAILAVLCRDRSFWHGGAR